MAYRDAEGVSAWVEATERMNREAALQGGIRIDTPRRVSKQDERSEQR